MACEVNNKEVNSQCAELLVRPTYISIIITFTVKNYYPLLRTQIRRQD